MKGQDYKMEVRTEWPIHLFPLFPAIVEKAATLELAVGYSILNSGAATSYSPCSVDCDMIVIFFCFYR